MTQEELQIIEDELRSQVDYVDVINRFDESKFGIVSSEEESSVILGKKLIKTFIYEEIYRDGVLIGLAGNGFTSEIINL